MTLGEQLGLFDSPARQAVARSRRDDPATSKVAAVRARGLAAEHHRQILAVMQAEPGRDWTPHEIAAAADMEPIAVSRRMRELWVLSRVVESIDGATGEVRTRPTPSGRPAGCWGLP